jgi:CubicO group peptidase (beta-lactamase class C family)
MTEIHGKCDDRFAAVRDVLANSIDAGNDVGGSFAATIDGETVVDIWGGWADEAQTKPWAQDTIINVYSTTKTMCALTAHLLADRGALDFAQKVAHYSPEFAANGKADVTVAQLMSHSAGVSGWKEPITKEVLYNWEQATGLLAAQAPFWEPGTQPGYHALTQGYLVGEVVRRIAGKSLGTVFREEIAGPLGADFHIGLPASEDARCAELVPPPPGGSLGMPTDNPLALSVMTNPPVNPLDTRTRAWRAAEIPAANGHGNARSVAEIHALFANGGVAKGKRILSEAGSRRPLEQQIEGIDLVLNMPVRYGLGFGMPTPTVPWPHPNTAFWGGYGGSLAIIDYDKRTTMSFVMNKMAPTTVGDLRAFMLAAEIWKVMG